MCRKPFTRLDGKPIGQPVDRAGESTGCWMRNAIETPVLRSQPCPEWRLLWADAGVSRHRAWPRRRRAKSAAGRTLAQSDVLTCAPPTSTYVNCPTRHMASAAKSP